MLPLRGALSPEQLLERVRNLDAFAGMLALDKWVCNADSRQAVFYRMARERKYTAVFIDHGHCFNHGEWNFPDAPLRGLYARSRVYEGVTGMDSFGPWLERMEKRITEKVLAELAEEIPPAWYEDDYDAVLRLLEQLQRRKPRVEELILSAKSSNRQPFGSWR